MLGVFIESRKTFLLGIGEENVINKEVLQMGKNPRLQLSSLGVAQLTCSKKVTLGSALNFYKTGVQNGQDKLVSAIKCKFSCDNSSCWTFSVSTVITIVLVPHSDSSCGCWRGP